MISEWLKLGLPDGNELEFLQEWFGSRNQVSTILNPFLNPIREYLGRPAKHARAQLVLASFEMVKRGKEPSPFEKSLLRALAIWVEILHAGSLIVDDIQDASTNRREGPALHELIGTASSINSANWLYFWPADSFSRLSPPVEMELSLYRAYHQMMSRAHLGQALDLDYNMTEVTREIAHSVSMAAVNLKTGELMAMSCEFGSIVSTADLSDHQALVEFGRSFGVALQMFNDLSEVIKMSVSPQSRVPLIRPSWVWQVASEILSDSEFQQFQTLMKSTGDWGDQFQIDSHPVILTARLRARDYMQSCIGSVRNHFHSSVALAPIEKLAEKVIHAYR